MHLPVLLHYRLQRKKEGRKEGRKGSAVQGNEGGRKAGDFSTNLPRVGPSFPLSAALQMPLLALPSAPWCGRLGQMLGGGNRGKCGVAHVFDSPFVDLPARPSQERVRRCVGGFPGKRWWESAFGHLVRALAAFLTETNNIGVVKSKKTTAPVPCCRCVRRTTRP